MNPPKPRPVHRGPSGRIVKVSKRKQRVPISQREPVKDSKEMHPSQRRKKKLMRKWYDNPVDDIMGWTQEDIMNPIEQAIDSLLKESRTQDITTTWSFMDSDYSEHEEMADYRMGEDVARTKAKINKIAQRNRWKVIEWIDDSDRSGMYAQVVLRVPEALSLDQAARILGKSVDEVEVWE